MCATSFALPKRQLADAPARLCGTGCLCAWGAVPDPSRQLPIGGHCGPTRWRQCRQQSPGTPGLRSPTPWHHCRERARWACGRRSATNVCVRAVCEKDRVAFGYFRQPLHHSYGELFWAGNWTPIIQLFNSRLPRFWFTSKAGLSAPKYGSAKGTHNGHATCEGWTLTGLCVFYLGLLCFSALACLSKHTSQECLVLALLQAPGAF